MQNVALEATFHEALVDCSEQNYSNLIVKWNVPNAAGKKKEIVKKIMF